MAGEDLAPVFVAQLGGGLCGCDEIGEEHRRDGRQSRPARLVAVDEAAASTCCADGHAATAAVGDRGLGEDEVSLPVGNPAFGDQLGAVVGHLGQQTETDAEHAMAVPARGSRCSGTSPGPDRPASPRRPVSTRSRLRQHNQSLVGIAIRDLRSCDLDVAEAEDLPYRRSRKFSAHHLEGHREGRRSAKALEATSRRPAGADGDRDPGSGTAARNRSAGMAGSARRLGSPASVTDTPVARRTSRPRASSTRTSLKVNVAPLLTVRARAMSISLSIVGAEGREGEPGGPHLGARRDCRQHGDRHGHFHQGGWVDDGRGGLEPRAGRHGAGGRSRPHLRHAGFRGGG